MSLAEEGAYRAAPSLVRPPRRADRPALSGARRADAHPTARPAARRRRDGARADGGLGTSQQNVSKHLGVLAQAGIVDRRKEGNLVRYAIADDSVFELCEQVCGGLRQQVSSSSTRSCRRSPREPTRSTPAHGWPLERVLFALAGTVTLLQRARSPRSSRPWFLLLTALRRAQPVALRRRRRLPGLVSRAVVSRCVRRLYRTGGASNDARRAARPPRPLDGRPTSASSPSPGSSRRRRPRRPRAAGRARALRRRLGGHRLGVGRGARRSSTASFGGLSSSAR